MQWNRIRPIIALAMLLSATPVIPAEIALDYDYFKIQVEPIFLKKRPDHGRCYVCHSVNNSAFRLEKLDAGKSGLDRGAIAAQFPKSRGLGGGGRTGEEQTTFATAGA